MSKTLASDGAEDSAKMNLPTLNNYHVRYWETNGNGFQFPEQSDPELQYKPIEHRLDRGVCFSGGGTVSVALIAGYLNALKILDLIDEIGYISGVSGGTWGTAPFMYYPGGNDLEVTGKHAPPGDLTWAQIETAAPGTLAGMCCKAEIADLSVAFLDYDLTQRKVPLQFNAFQEAVGQIFLHPAHIVSPIHQFDKWEKTGKKVPPRKPVMSTLQENRNFFSTDKEAVNNVVGRNRSYGEEDFIKLKLGRPYYIMNTTMLVPKEKGDKHPTVYPFEFTPLYAGMFPNHGKDPVTQSQQIGGTYVESYGFNTVAHKAADDGVVNAGNNYRLDLCQPTGTSGAAVAEALQGNALKRSFPNFKYWNPKGTDEKPTTERYYFGDGGIIENTGIISLLIRKLNNIVAFVSQMTYYFENGDPNAEIDLTYSGWDQLVFGYNEIACLFGGQLIDGKAAKEYHKANKHATSVKVTWKDDDFNGGPAGGRKVFADDANHTNLNNLIAAFKFAEQNGGPITANIQPQVVANALFGISAEMAEGYTPNVKFTMLGNCAQWTEKLPTEISDKIGKGTLKDFPNVKTFAQNPGYLIQLTPDQANMLGNLAFWAVMEERDVYTSLMTGKGFPAGSEPK